ncbi:MAG TPA: DnaB-like helicase C-terminal domain-containing protein, partial [Candidatus Limnocylindria bacterium]|nr:DnaB-like helicase C-terminal domain-containing protein [Candidatus Limnocylindria bacterium]
ADRGTGEKHTDYLIQALRNDSYARNWRHIMQATADCARRARAGDAARGLLAALQDTRESLDDILQGHAAALRGIAKGGGGSAVTSAQAAVSCLDGLKGPRAAAAMFGVEMLDHVVGGMLAGTLCVVGARPGTGKSALAMSAAVCTQAKGSVLFCSYEMRAEEIAGRALAAASGLDASAIARGDLSDADYALLARHADRVAGMNLFFAGAAATPARVRTEAERLKRDGSLRLVVVDYLQLMSSGMRAESRRVEVGQISRALKALAMDLDVPVLALSQLNRQSEATPSRAPGLSDLRESGDIEQDADVVVLMYAPPGERDAADPRGTPCAKDGGQVPVRFHVAKNRQGRAGRSIQILFDGAHMRFLEDAGAVR